MKQKSRRLVLLITGPSGVGKSHFAHSHYPGAIRLDSYRAKSNTATWKGLPRGEDVYEGSVDSEDPIILKLGVRRVIILMPPLGAFREANRLKYLYSLTRLDWPDRWRRHFKKLSLITLENYEILMDRTVRSFKRLKDVQVELLGSEKGYFPVKAWHEDDNLLDDATLNPVPEQSEFDASLETCTNPALLMIRRHQNLGEIMRLMRENRAIQFKLNPYLPKEAQRSEGDVRAAILNPRTYLNKSVKDVNSGWCASPKAVKTGTCELEKPCILCEFAITKSKADYVNGKTGKG